MFPIYFQCESVDKRHAVVTFDHYLRRFKVKDLSTANGVGENQVYITTVWHHMPCDEKTWFLHMRKQRDPAVREYQTCTNITLSGYPFFTPG